MAYATVADMYVRYQRAVLHDLADKKIDYDDTGEPLQTVEQVIEAALTDASVAIDGYIDGRATLPLKTIPAALVRHCCVLARYAMEEGAATEKAEKEYEATLSYLNKVATGDISLGLTKEEARPEAGDAVVFESAGSVWTRKGSKGFI
ncbi:Mu-like prophage protein gp36 [Leminorella richardii]|uniref:Mu-like prophage protein gp36 n=1 Tax=Leminorella richardii TaxID=158841 RepID=A0A2X4U519_9GAMM|nr:phage protein Gp36 family protein [Leminorella richardii]SQI34947.1 Mu-like prophage protein gp36 [Leminorella richardii]